MITRTWLGNAGDWYSTSDWSNGVPIPGDSVIIAAGNAMLIGSEATVSGTFDAETVTLGSSNKAAPAEITAENSIFGHFFTITSATGAAFAEIVNYGTSGYAGQITASAANGTFTIQTETTAGANGGDFVLLHGGSISVTSGDTFDLSGRIDDEGTFSVSAGSTFVNDGTVNVISSNVADINSAATLAGTGTITVGIGSTLFIEGASNSETLGFNSVDGKLKIGSLSTFKSPIVNFRVGDLIDLVNVVANSVTYDVTTGLLVAYEISNGATTEVAALNVAGPTSSGAVVAVSDTAGGTYLEYSNTLARKAYQIQAGDDAMGSNIVRATLTTQAGAPINGTGIKIGILSDSFNYLGGANADAQAGYLPLNTLTGMSAVVDLKDGTATNSADEGRAMAELIHQVAPGAQIYFYTAENGQSDFANGINEMVADGVNVIVDDWSFSGEPFFQVAGPVDTAIQNAINAGVSYFTSASNYGNAYYQANFTDTATTLMGVSGQVQAQTFSDGTNYQTITIPGGYNTTLALQWDAPFPALGGSSPVAMVMALYDMNNNLVETSTQVTGGPYASEPEIQLSIKPNSTTATSYRLAIYQTTGMPTVSLFKYIMFGGPASAQDPGGYIDDPAAMNGSGSTHGHDLVPGVNTVAATTFSNSPAYTGVSGLPEFFSSSGPGTLLFDSSGNRLASPVSDGKPNFTAPDGIYNSTDLTDFQPFYGTSAAAPNAAAVAALMLQANPRLTPAQVTQDLEASALSGGNASSEGAGLIQAVNAVESALACFVTGTRLETPAGAIAVEKLRVGDLVQTLSGKAKQVIWIGRRRVNVSLHPLPESVTPVRILANAIKPRLPARDVLLSPDHCIYDTEERVLVPARHLVNGTTIVRHPVRDVTYWHVELAEQDVLLADGLQVESYLDTGTRASFANGGLPVFAVADFVGHQSKAGSCAPVVVNGATLARIRARLEAAAMCLVA